MPTGRIPLLAAGLLLPLSACAPAGGGEEAASDPFPLPATEISPDGTVSCRDSGDCGEPGALYWSTPLDGAYHAFRYDTDPPLFLHEDDWLGAVFPYFFAPSSGGALHLFEQDRVTSVDAETGERRWTDVLDPGSTKRVEEVVAAGDTLVVRAQDDRDEAGEYLYLVQPGDDGLDWLRVDVPGPAGLSTVGGTDAYVLVELRPEDEYALVDATDGDTVWQRAIPGGFPVLTDEAVYSADRAESDSSGDGVPRLYRTALDDGGVEEVPLPGAAVDAGALNAVAGGTLVFGETPCKKGRQHTEDGCRTGPLVGVDPADGEVLWEHDDAVLVAADADEGLVHVFGGERVDRIETLDAQTGEAVEQGSTPIDAFDARRTEFDPGGDELAVMTPTFGLHGPGVPDGTTTEAAVGARHLTSLTTPEGTAVAVFHGCAPDSVGRPAPDAPAGGRPCASPRLFAVGYGV
ncbi:outer membrane protein assembly factor BamB family protein [Nocardiopsis chromatogenes]|uniref:outer membrane protein assembly factor BamB family protein n=1 Tax=Nocardiopsis chromatogenes TaxID=280239 RepID=UPI00034BF036|nr:PQQ-binding-like beta-propeller repeat protein [Nocardiopsis chromatogenes]